MAEIAITAATSVKARLKQALQARPGLWRRYWRLKQEIKRVAMLRYFFYDIGHTYRAMFWPANQQARQALSAELLFQYHKLEKGLVMPGPRRLFGVEAAMAVMEAVDRWRAAGLDSRDTVFVGALVTLHAYRNRLSMAQLDSNGIILPHVERFLERIGAIDRESSLSTPQALPNESISGVSGNEAFRQLVNARRSVRDFLPNPVDRATIDEAVRIAQLSPSACNRQPCSVYLVSDEVKKRRLLALQNGNRGFGHLAPHIAIVTADERCFFDASERHEPYVDGGLFAMSFILSLRAHGVGSCCLNWCVAPKTDQVAHELLGVDTSRRIVMLIAFGYAPENCIVPRSPRRDLNEVLIEL